MTSVLEIEGVTRRFGGLAAVNDLTFTVNEHEIVGLIGPNGAGKTTCFNLLSGAMPVTSGTIKFKGQDIAGLKAQDVCALGLARTFQVVQPFPYMTALENAMVGAFLRHPHRDAAMKAAREALAFVGLESKADVRAKALPLMDLKRLEIGKAMATAPEMLLLDEVASGLTPVELEGMLTLVRRLRDEGMTLLVIEHVMQVIMNLSDRIVVLNFGTKISEGTPQAVSRDQAVLDAYLGEDEYVA